MTTLLNKIVVVLGDPRLFAKVRRLERDHVTVEFFNSVVSRETRCVRKSDVAHTELPKHTRVFVKIGDFWKVGRVVGTLEQPNGTFVYSVKFPNIKEVDVHEDRLLVRCLDTFADPAAILGEGCAETQFFADRRRRALRRLRELRSSAQGLTGLISAAIDLIPYQAATVRRVLQDPSLRYLLADEVGLGKTIEAGAIIRQVLIDDSNRTAVVIAPSGIVRQWQALCHDQRSDR